MIGTVEWRCVIGLYIHKSNKQTKQPNKNNSAKQKQDSSDLCGRLFILVITFWMLNFEFQFLSTIMDPQWNSLLLSNDVESNPGPSIEEQISTMSSIMSDMSSTMLAQFHNLNTKLDNVNREVSILRGSMDVLKSSLDDMTRRVAYIEDKQKTLQLDAIANNESIERAESRIDSIEHKIEQQARDNIRNNVLLHGVPETDEETDESVLLSVLCVLNKHIPKKTWTSSDIAHSHRLGKRTENIGKNRPTIVKFNYRADKHDVIKARDQLRKEDMGVSNDLTPFQRNELSIVKQSGKFGYYKSGNLVITEDRQTNKQSDQHVVITRRRLDQR